LAVAKIDGLTDTAAGRVAAVVARHERTLMRVARQASMCHDDALDAYQRGLEIFVRRVDTVAPETEVAWLKVVVRHEAMAIRRSRMESVTGDELDLDAIMPGPDRTVDEQIASGERVRRSAEALRALKPDEAKALMMKAHGLSYEEIGERYGWSYTKVNRAVTEGRRRFMRAYREIESGAECERYGAIVKALSEGSATTAQVLQIRPHLRHCTACRAAVRELRVSRLRRASLFWPVFVVAEPFARLAGAKHEAAALLHRAQASDLVTGTGLAGAGGGGGGRVATVGAVLGLCLGGASVGTVCVVTGAVPDLGGGKPARVEAKHDPPRRQPPERRATPATPDPDPPVTRATFHTAVQTTAKPRRASKPKASTTRARRRQAAKEAAPREFGFENQAPAQPPATTASSAAPPASPPPAPSPTSTSKTFSPAEQEFAP
jgi:RNA polymerase sigma factor (sigma-70 family)